jgi:hypothetical protein
MRSADTGLSLALTALFGAAGCGLPSTHLAATRWTGGDGATGGLDGSTRNGCLETDVDLTRPTGTVVLVVERSSAMNTLNDATCATCGTYFTAVERTVQMLTTATSNRFRWGLKLFPSPTDASGCAVTPTLDVAPAADAHTAVAAALAAAAPSGGAPLTAAIDDVSGYLNGLPDMDPKLIVLATAGAPTCAGNDPSQDDLSAAVAAVDAAPQFTFVLGLGSEHAHFDRLAGVGATDTAYSSDQASSLLRDLESLADELGTCVYPVPGGPLGDRSLAVVLDGAALTAGATDGFSVSTDGVSVRLRGAACFSSHASLVIRAGCGS